MMYRIPTYAAAILLLGMTTALAVEQPAPPTGQSATPEASKSATIPQSGSADTSGGAREQSSSPPQALSTGPSGAQAQAPGNTMPNPSAPASQD